MNENNQAASQLSGDVANKNYDPADYEDSNELSQGLAVTHEQVGDVYKVGTIDDHYTGTKK